MLLSHSRFILSKLPENRLLAIDAFRGLTITAMILVNNPGSWQHIYAPLKHAQWHGWTFTDLIFPFFIFIVGISIHLSLVRQMIDGTTKTTIISSAFVRAAKLFALGLFLALFYYNFSAAEFDWVEQRLISIRIMGVLQRIGVVYLLTILIAIYWKTFGQIVWLILLLVGYWALITFVSYSDQNGNLYQGQLEFGNSLVAWIDHHVLGTAHLYYKSSQPFAFDPEGLLSTLPAIASCLTGVLAGKWISRPNKNHSLTIYGFLLAGLLLAGVGQTSDIYLPINKALWTPSYVLLTSGLACIFLSALIWLLDLRKVQLWSAPFVVFGANSILFFMFSAILARILLMVPVEESNLKYWIYTNLFQSWAGDINGSLAFAISFLLVSYVAMFGFYRNGVFWKV